MSNPSLGYWNETSQWVPFQVDYKLPEKQVFINVAKAIMETTKSLEILRFAGQLRNKTIGMPSWVPNWADAHPVVLPGYPRIVSTRAGTKETWRDDGECSAYPTNGGIADALWRTLNNDFDGKSSDQPVRRYGHLENIQKARLTLASMKTRYFSTRSDNPGCPVRDCPRRSALTI